MSPPKDIEGTRDQYGTEPACPVRQIVIGIYGVIRHPMYASQWLLAIAQPLLLQNWIAGFLNLLVFIPFYLFRVKAEEQLMIEQFGDRYRTYMHKVGGVLPKM